VVIGLVWKELKLATFDAGLAVALGFAPVALNYLLMTLVSVTAVGAFNAVGSILVVALMIAPPAAAYLLTDGLARMAVLACAIGGVSAIAGYWLAVVLDASIAGCIAAACGAAFAAAWILAPSRGLIAAARRRARQRLEFAQVMLAIHLANHEGLPEASRESTVHHLGEHLRWDDGFASDVVRGATRRGLVVRAGDALTLTESGREIAREAIAR
jgi:manganese/zinc/iron transport system permease protein